MSSAAARGTVLVVDDQSGIRQLIRRVLQIQGYTVIDAADGPTAIERFDSEPEPMLALIDITMPGMDGVTLAGRLRNRCPSLPIVLMSGFDMDEVFEPGTTIAPPASYLEKPFDISRLVATVEALLQQRSQPEA